jgi:hypothetical protein
MAENALDTIIISIPRHVIRDASKKPLRQYGGPKPAQCGCCCLETNHSGGFYRKGVSYDILTKLKVVIRIKNCSKRGMDLEASLRAARLREVAREARVSYSCVI